MNKAVITFVIIASVAFLNALNVDSNSSFDGPRNGYKWADWHVLPGEVFNNRENYYFFDNIDFNRSPYFTEAGDSVSIKISLPHPVTDYPNSFYQICYGSFEDPYHLSGLMTGTNAFRSIAHLV